MEVKRLRKYRPPDGPFLIQAQTLGCVFAFTSDLTLDKLAEHFHRLLLEYGLGGHVDIVLVLDKGIIALAGTAPGMQGWGISILEEVPENAEGAHLGVAVRDLGLGSLDAFLRFILMHLSYFHGRVDHPGFWNKDKDQPMKVTYITSFTMERDPVRREERLRAYAEQVRKEFENGSAG